MKTHNGFLVGPRPADLANRWIAALRLPPGERDKAFEALRKEQDDAAREHADRAVAARRRA